MARKTIKPDSLHVIDDLINGDDGLRQWTFGYDDDGALGAPDDELIDNVVGIIERAQTLVRLAKRRGVDAGIYKVHKSDATELTTTEIRKVVLMLFKEATGSGELA